MKLKLAKTSKMPCKSWSLNALDTCAGSIGEDGELVAACEGCYATTGFYLMASVRDPRTFNRKDWRREDWVNDMVESIGNDRYFRWFDSGDVYHTWLAAKIRKVMELTPDCQHWLPTRMHKFAKFRPELARMNALPNVVVRHSSDGINGEPTDGKYTSTIIPAELIGDFEWIEGITVCEAYSRSGKCGDCRACWSQDVPVIAYPQHGRKMAKVHIELHG